MLTPGREPVWAEKLDLVGVAAALVAISRSSTTHARPCKHCQKLARHIRLQTTLAMNYQHLKSLSLLNDASMDNAVLPVLTSALASLCWHTVIHGMQWPLFKHTQAGLHFDFLSHASAHRIMISTSWQQLTTKKAHNQNTIFQPKENT
jgi:hypothetical protein